MYSRIVKIVPVTKTGEDEEDLQFGIMDPDSNTIMAGFINFQEAEDELEYRKDEEEKIGDFGGDT